VRNAKPLKQGYAISFVFARMTAAEGTCHSAVCRCRQLLSPVPNESPKADPKVERNVAELTARSKPPVAVMDTELWIERTPCASDRSAT